MASNVASQWVMKKEEYHEQEEYKVFLVFPYWGEIFLAIKYA